MARIEGAVRAVGIDRIRLERRARLNSRLDHFIVSVSQCQLFGFGCKVRGKQRDSRVVNHRSEFVVLHGDGEGVVREETGSLFLKEAMGN